MASENEKNFQTRAGVAPSESGLPFSITTDDVEKYLQSKVDVVCNRISKDTNEKLSVDIKLYTTEAGKKFLPFVVILPLDVLKSKGKKKNNEPDIFNPKDDDRSANMRDEIATLFGAYAFNKDDQKAFFSDDWRRRCGVLRETSSSLASLRTAKVTTLDNNKMHVVVFMIDPLRVFHDMLIMPNDKRQFRVDIDSWKKLRTGCYQYNLKRNINSGKNNRKYRDELYNELNRRIRGNN